MERLAAIISDSQALVDDIRDHAEGVDPKLLLEVTFLSDADFSEPMDGETLLAALRAEGLL